MCLAVPAQIIKIDEHNRNRALVDYRGIKRWAGIYLVPEASPGDYVIIHAGEAISLLEEKEAKKTLELWEEYHEPKKEE